jgi:CRISPR/Cas system CSM-associated protein Csm3 (group 7 of RAMP superfamily)
MPDFVPMYNIRIDLTITARTALSVGAGGSAGTLADKSIIRDGYDRPIIPGSQVKGKARHAVEAVLRGLGLDKSVPEHFDAPCDSKNPNPVHRIFGAAQCGSPLRFADLHSFSDQTRRLSPEARAIFSSIRPSVTINRERGVAQEQRLLLQETAVETLAYHSTHAITGQLSDEGLAALLWAALKLTPRWGGAKSRGLGWADVAIGVLWDDATTPMSEKDLEDALRRLIERERSR